jgi:hypothetical protein
MMDMDVEAYPELHRDGYPAVAAWIARDPDNETFIYRKFDRLAARNLLHMQSELIALEAELREHDALYRTTRDGMRAARSWEKLSQDEASVRLAKKLQSKIKAYRECHVPILILVAPPFASADGT